MKNFCKTFLFILLSSVCGNAVSQSSAKNTNTVAMCGCPGEVWNFDTPFQPKVEFPIPNNSKRLMHTDYNFSIPVTATITGIQVTYTYNSQGAGASTLKDSLCMLFYNGGMIGNDKSPETGFYGNTGIINFGGQNDTWGVALTPDIVNSQFFGFNFKAYSSVANTTLSFQSGVLITVHYQLTAGISESQRSSGSMKAFYHNGFLNIENLQSEPATIDIINITGRRVKSAVIENKTETIDLSAIEKGIYFYRLQCGKKIKTGKFVLE